MLKLFSEDFHRPLRLDPASGYRYPLRQQIPVAENTDDISAAYWSLPIAVTGNLAFMISCKATTEVIGGALRLVFKRKHTQFNNTRTSPAFRYDAATDTDIVELTPTRLSMDKTGAVFYLAIETAVDSVSVRAFWPLESFSLYQLNGLESAKYPYSAIPIADPFQEPNLDIDRLLVDDFEV
jgi:hypothetical protein